MSSIAVGVSEEIESVDTLFSRLVVDFEGKRGHVMDLVSPVTSKPATRGRIKTGHSEVLNSYLVS